MDYARLIRESRNGRGSSASRRKRLADCLEFEKALDLKIERLYHFASLQLAEDSANNDYLVANRTVAEFADKASAKLPRFVVPEIQAIDDGRSREFMADPALKEWRIHAAQNPPDDDRMF